MISVMVATAIPAAKLDLLAVSEVLGHNSVAIMGIRKTPKL